MPVIRPLFHAALFGLACVAFAISAPLSSFPDDQEGIKEALNSYAAAFNSGDAKAVANHWAEDAEFTAPSGVTYKGRNQIREAFDVLFSENKGGALTLTETETLFDSPDRARTRGTATVTRDGATVSETEFITAYVKKEGSWKVASVWEAPGASPGYTHLKDLEWLIGDWVAGDDDARAESSFEWTAHKNFISVTFKGVDNGEQDTEGIEVIGWDPTKKIIRSWFFDSTGRFGEGVWTKDGDRWTVKTTATLGRGQKASAINVFVPVDHDSFKWSSNGREVGGEPLPDTHEQTVTRRKSGK